MKRKLRLMAALLALGLAATASRADDLEAGSPRERAMPVPGVINGLPSQHAPPPARCAETSCLQRAWNWLTYRAPIRGSFCRGFPFGTQEHHPPLYTYFPPLNGCAGGPLAAPAPYPAQLPPPRPLYGARAPAHTFIEKPEHHGPIHDAAYRKKL